jgi:ABC-type bacteriocin/lantibiotic exporter with double-glycine peptidase domain
MSTSIEESNYKYKVAGWLEELARVVRSFKFSKGTLLNLRKTDQLVDSYLNARTAHFKVLLFQYWALIGFKMLITAAMLIVGSILLINQQLNLGQFIASEIVILLVLNSVEKLIVNLDRVYDVLTSVEKLSKVIDQPVDEDGKMHLKESTRGISVNVQNLSFKYDKRPVLKNISFNIEPGQKVAVIGEDGSGKSTLLRVLSGAYKSYEGGILLDNVPMKNYLSDSVRKKTGILLSQQDIFNGTILENITMGNSEISPGDVMLLSEKIGLKNFIEEQHEGFETILDPVGKRLSRNIIQKILLLRALVNDPRLLLLEEPWSNLDELQRRSIQEYFLENNKDCTILVATTSDDEFVAKCDMVLYMKDGQLVNAESWNEPPKN